MQLGISISYSYAKFTYIRRQITNKCWQISINYWASSGQICSQLLV